MLEKLVETRERHKLVNTKELEAVARIEAALLKGARDYFIREGFIEVNAPHITKATGSCENINTLFALDYFGIQGYLSQTQQLYLEAMIPRLKKVKAPFQRLPYDEAVKKLSSIKWGDDLKSAHEKMLVEMLGNQPLFITHFPKKIKFFNMRENDFRAEIVNSADFILPGSGEAVGAAEREYRHDKLREKLENSMMMQQLKTRGGSIEDFAWYLDCVKSNGIKLHSGCGIGLNRVTQFVLGADDIRKSTVFPLNSETIM